ncbi:MAG TPA: glycerophosphodiester phosphodiesterase [Polyangiaceae bacterium]|nr:glycerophosphodiester phosphodiesterase [Polyangiaceae bacterium]
MDRLVRGRAKHWRRKAERPWVLGHRGARHTAPENTMAAFELALREGADGVELDVRLDRDGDVVVIHDATLARVTGGADTRDVDRLGRAELARVDVGRGERVPRLAEVLSWSRTRGARVNIELKSDLRRRAWLALKVAALLVREPHAAERLILSSFDPKLVLASARLLPWVPVGYLVERRFTLGARASKLLLGAAAVHPNASMVSERAILPWRRAKMPVNVWTVNAPDEARRLDALGVDSIITDEPGKILAALSSRTP